jgi:hypothetical protein
MKQVGFFRNFKDETSMLLLTFLVHVTLFHQALFMRVGGRSFVKASEL